MSGAAPEGKYQDHYLVLGVAPKASMEEIHQAYQALVKECHPQTGAKKDAERFKSVNQAYEVLSDPATRRMFDDLRPDENKDKPPVFEATDFFQQIATEDHRRLTVLCLLYDRRRFRPVTGNLSQRHLEQMMATTPEELQLTMWYLQKKGFVEMNDKSSYLLTVEGMDYIESRVPPQETVLSLLKEVALPEDRRPKKPEPAPEAQETESPADSLSSLQKALAQETPAAQAPKPAGVHARFRFNRPS